MCKNLSKKLNSDPKIKSIVENTIPKKFRKGGFKMVTLNSLNAYGSVYNKLN